MGNKLSSYDAAIEEVKQKEAKLFLQKITKQFQSFDEPNKKKQRIAEGLLSECIEWITSHYTTLSSFSLCISEKTIEENIMEGFCQVLKSETNLTSLAVINCNLSKAALTHLTEAIKVNSTLRTLNLSYNDLGVSGYQILVNGLKLNTSLRNLFLENTKAGDNGIIQLSQSVATKRLQRISLKYNDVTQLGIAALSIALKSNYSICEINIEECNDVNTSELDPILRRNYVLTQSISYLIDNTFKSLSKKLQETKSLRTNSAPLPRSHTPPVTPTPSRLVTNSNSANNNNNAGSGGGGGSSNPPRYQSNLSMSTPEPSESPPVTRGRARGGTIDMSLLPSVMKSKESSYEIKDFGDSESKRFIVGSAHTIGRRPEMQDTMLLQGCFNEDENQDLFCIFDGHGSQQSAIYAATHISKIFKSYLTQGISIPHALRSTFLQLDKEISEFAINHGTTAVVAYIHHSTLYVANVGDSRAVLCRKGKAVRLTVDHKPELPGETERIKLLGGEIINKRVMGALAITRALGDAFAGRFVTAEPYITITQLNNEDKFLLLACDGLFDIFVDEIAVEIAKNNPNPKQASERLKDQAFISGSTDNISVAVINFQSHFSSITPPPPEVTDVISSSTINNNSDNGGDDDNSKGSGGGGGDDGDISITPQRSYVVFMGDFDASLPPPHIRISSDPPYILSSNNNNNDNDGGGDGSGNVVNNDDTNNNNNDDDEIKSRSNSPQSGDDNNDGDKSHSPRSSLLHDQSDMRDNDNDNNNVIIDNRNKANTIDIKSEGRKSPRSTSHKKSKPHLHHSSSPSSSSPHCRNDDAAGKKKKKKKKSKDISSSSDNNDGDDDDSLTSASNNNNGGNDCGNGGGGGGGDCTSSSSDLNVSSPINNNNNDNDDNAEEGNHSGGGGGSGGENVLSSSGDGIIIRTKRKKEKKRKTNHHHHPHPLSSSSSPSSTPTSPFTSTSSPSSPAIETNSPERNNTSINVIGRSDDNEKSAPPPSSSSSSSPPLKEKKKKRKNV